MIGSSPAECRAAPGGCGNIFCARCRTARLFDDPAERHRVKSILGGKARARDGSLAKAAGAARAARFAAMSPEEKRLDMAKVQAGRIMASVARWPFPHGPKMSKAEAIAKARATLAAKVAQSKLSREKRLAAICAERAAGKTYSAIADQFNISTQRAHQIVKQRVRRARQRRDQPAAPSRR